ncbi:MAG: hypothetical protein WCP21_21935 [Armatimonadota bacterium]
MMRRALIALLPVLLVGLLLPLLVGGCKSGGKSAQAVAATYVGLMTNEKYEEAAKLWDYVTQARKDNEGWDDIQEGQRKLILDKLAEEKAPSLKLWSGYFPGGTKVTQVQESGESATAQLEGGRVQRLELVKVGEGWKIAGME